MEKDSTGLRKIVECVIKIPNNLYHTLSVKFPFFEYRFPIKDYPKSSLEFLEIIREELNNQNLCLQNAEYHSPRLNGFIPVRLTGTLYYAEERKGGLVGDIKWGSWKIVNFSI